jgi:EAL domain-containing protein (putative c-di-GMP-specific phosphodiesterase class I)
MRGDHLEFEVTESVLMDQIEHRANELEQLRNLGIRLSVDDFGTGYSSLSYLHKLPIDKLKIDRSFVRDVTLDPDDATITATIIRMAHSIGLKVVAEGVETNEQMGFLRARGCDEAQGFLFGTPMPPRDFAAHLRRRESRLRRVA